MLELQGTVWKKRSADSLRLTATTLITNFDQPNVRVFVWVELIIDGSRTILLNLVS